MSPDDSETRYTEAENDALMALSTVASSSSSDGEMADHEMVTEQLLKLNGSPKQVPNNNSTNLDSNPTISPVSFVPPQTSHGSPASICSVPERAPVKAKIKYDILENGVAYPRQCGDCNAKHTSGHWCLDAFVHNGHICQKCYRRRRRAIDSGRQYKQPHRECSTCGGQTKSKWFRHGSKIGLYLCDGCYLPSKLGSCQGCGSNQLVETSEDGAFCKWCRGKKAKPQKPSPTNSYASSGHLSPVSQQGSIRPGTTLPSVHQLSAQWVKPKQELRGNPYLPPIHFYLSRYSKIK